MTGKPPFEIVKTTLGKTSIRDLKTGEILHNPVGPWAEANDLYVSQTSLVSRLQDPSLLPKPLVLFDVGLGAGFNAVAALQATSQTQKSGRARPLKLVSFESNMEIFDFTLTHLAEFPFMAPWEEMMRDLLKKGRAESEGVTWHLRKGPFEKTIQSETESPEIVFFDPYSPKTNPEMWEFTVLHRLHQLARSSVAPVLLATYSMSTAVRVTFLLAGFFVGFGPSSGAKTETTLASTRLESLAHPLGRRWLERWARSRTPYPLGLPPESLDSLGKKLHNHAQFAAFRN